MIVKATSKDSRAAHCLQAKMPINSAGIIGALGHMNRRKITFRKKWHFIILPKYESWLAHDKTPNFISKMEGLKRKKKEKNL